MPNKLFQICAQRHLHAWRLQLQIQIETTRYDKGFLFNYCWETLFEGINVLNTTRHEILLYGESF